MRYHLTYLLLRLLKALTRLFYTAETEWIDGEPDDPWGTDYRLVSILNHTSLYEVLFAAIPGKPFLRRMARYGVVPVALKTIKRPIVGKFFRLIAGNVVPISRERDHTWAQVLDSVGPESMVVILPEGRMKRADGRDSYGRELVIRGGIADLIKATGSGKWLMCYSLGLHHIQIPGEMFPRLFKPLRMRFEVFDIAEYCARLGADDPEEFRLAVIRDLTERRDRYCAAELGGQDVETVTASDS